MLKVEKFFCFGFYTNLDKLTKAYNTAVFFFFLMVILIILIEFFKSEYKEEDK